MSPVPSPGPARGEVVFVTSIVTHRAFAMCFRTVLSSGFCWWPILQRWTLRWERVRWQALTSHRDRLIEVLWMCLLPELRPPYPKNTRPLSPAAPSPCPASGHIRGELTGGWPSKAGEWSTDTLAPENVPFKRLVSLWASVSPSVKGTTRLDSLQVFSGLRIPMHLILNFIYQ